MPSLKRLFALFLLTALAGCATIPSETATPSPQTLRRGVNVLGYDPIWQDPARARFKARHFAEIRAGGFDFVRVNLFGFKAMDAQNRLEPKWLERLDWVVREAKAAGLSVILDEHDFNACAENVPACRPRLAAFWRQVAARYRDEPASVYFELLNEPFGALDAETWNGLFAELLAIVRETNPSRTVIIGPARWNNFAELPNLRLPPEDRNILVTFHYYDPFRFTHQGASWTDLTQLRGVTWGSESDRQQLRADFARVKQWSRENDRPILLGEFGAYDKSGTPMEMRAAYTDAVAREAEADGFAWAYWQFDSDFVVWDMARDQWVKPILDALVPEGR
jgi:endoglucanase